jgi:hypothetical protein
MQNEILQGKMEIGARDKMIASISVCTAVSSPRSLLYARGATSAFPRVALGPEQDYDGVNGNLTQRRSICQLSQWVLCRLLHSAH